MMVHRITRHLTPRLMWLFMLLGGCIALTPNVALAQTSPACNAPAQSTIQLGNVSISPNTPNGPIQGAQAWVYITFDCSNVFSQYPSWQNQTIQVHGLAPRAGTIPPAATLMFQTSIPGIAVVLRADPTAPSDGPNGPGGDAGWELGSMCPGGNEYGVVTCNEYGNTLTASFTAQLYKIGPVTPGTFQITPVAKFTNYGYGYSNSAPDYAQLNIGEVTISVPSCSVVTDPTHVILPNVLASQFTGVDHTASETPFQIQLDCPQSLSGSEVVVTLDSSAKVSGKHGVIAPTQGNSYAKGVGVQILDGNGDEIDFGSPTPARNITAGNVNIPFRARYYQTGTQVGSGLVEATATYTLTYQ